MDRTVLVSAVGFRPQMVLPVVEAIQPDAIHLIAGRHSDVAKAEETLLIALKKTRVPVAVRHVEDDWDIQAWSDAIADVLEHLKDDRAILNVTAGHGSAVSMLGVHAAKRSLPLVCFDWESYGGAGSSSNIQDYVYMHSPAALLNWNSTLPIDRRILTQLLKGPSAVNDLATAVDDPQSTVSTSLGRLLDNGFLDRREDGRQRVYSVRVGLEAMLRKAMKR